MLGRGLLPAPAPPPPPSAHRAGPVSGPGRHPSPQRAESPRFQQGLSGLWKSESSADPPWRQEGSLEIKTLPCRGKYFPLSFPEEMKRKVVEFTRPPPQSAPEPRGASCRTEGGGLGGQMLPEGPEPTGARVRLPCQPRALSRIHHRTTHTIKDDSSYSFRNLRPHRC